jgi:hypothetical protein
MGAGKRTTDSARLSSVHRLADLKSSPEGRQFKSDLATNSVVKQEGLLGLHQEALFLNCS